MILSELTDASTPWLADHLSARGINVDIVWSSDLDMPASWHHRVDADGVSTEITLRDGRIIESTNPQPIINRLSFVPTDTLRLNAGSDFGYTVQELFALHLSWLHAWPAPVVNRPTPQGLGGNYRHPSMWATLGVRAGLPTRPWYQSEQSDSNQSWVSPQAEAVAFTIGDEVILPGVLSKKFEEGCRTLSRLAGTALIGIDFSRNDRGLWLMVGASPIPNLVLGGDRLVAALASAVS